MLILFPRGVKHSKKHPPLHLEFSTILSLWADTGRLKRSFCAQICKQLLEKGARSQEKHSSPNRKQVSSNEHDTVLASERSAQHEEEKKKGITSHGQKKESGEEGAQCLRLLETLERVLCRALGWTRHSGWRILLQEVNKAPWKQSEMFKTQRMDSGIDGDVTKAEKKGGCESCDEEVFSSVDVREDGSREGQLKER